MKTANLNNLAIIENTNIFCRFKEFKFNSNNFQLVYERNKSNLEFQAFLLLNYPDLFTILIINNNIDKAIRLKDVGIQPQYQYNNLINRKNDDGAIDFIYNDIDEHTFTKDDITNLLLSLC